MLQVDEIAVFEIFAVNGHSVFGAHSNVNE